MLPVWKPAGSSHVYVYTTRTLARPLPHCALRLELFSGIFARPCHKLKSSSWVQKVLTLFSPLLRGNFIVKLLTSVGILCTTRRNWLTATILRTKVDLLKLLASVPRDRKLGWSFPVRVWNNSVGSGNFQRRKVSELHAWSLDSTKGTDRTYFSLDLQFPAVSISFPLQIKSASSYFIP